MLISPVLRKSDSFDERHVYWLKRQIDQHYPDATFMPYSDVPLDIPHVLIPKGLPKWWAKMYIAHSLPQEAVLVPDLDVVVLRRTEFDTSRPYVLRHPTRHSPKEINCGLMLWTPEFARKLQEHFFFDPDRYMLEANGDDQMYFSRYFGTEMGRFQDGHPDEFVSYKFTTVHWGLRPANAWIMFHGHPRPWDANETWIPPLDAGPRTTDR